MTKIEEIATAMELAAHQWALGTDNEPWEVPREVIARAAVEAMRGASLPVLKAMHEAMFADKWDATSAAMVGAGFDAVIDSILSEAAP